ncbi:hypothetical protein FCM35_KLT04723 [Carex littledalei]|uniref:Uncharacterized protein n=1 Tax=Carex littledalei TaxID=544730 RepID=A0A833QYX6_9POAL|nr:hypothetical protein FCM35_KLT04723 [Carex littledalei]
MEGLIPFIFKAIKRKRTRMCYRSLSTGAMRGFDMSDFHNGKKLSLRSPPRKFGSFKGDNDQRCHRRHNSMEDYSASRECNYSPDRYESYDMPRHLTKRSGFGSLRIFSCAGGF